MSDSKAGKVAISTGSVIRIPQYDTAGGYRLYLVTATRLGATNEESVYEIYPLDVVDAKRMEVPCVLLDTHPGLQLPTSLAFYENVINPKSATAPRTSSPSIQGSTTPWTIKS